MLYVAFIICRSRATVQLPGFAKYVVCCIPVLRVAHVPGVVIGIRVRYVPTFALYATIFTQATVPASGVAVANCVAFSTMILYHVPVLDVTCSMLAKTVEPWRIHLASESLELFIGWSYTNCGQCHGGVR